MTLRPSKFKQGDGLSLIGRAARVAGVIQYEDATGQAVTRYLAVESSGAPTIIEETAEGYVLLGSFPANAQPSASGNSVSVLGEKYALKGVRKLSLLGSAGQIPGGVPKSDLLLSGEFSGSMGSVLREMVPGAGTQIFYLLRQLRADDVLSNDEIASRLEAGRRDAEARGSDDEEEPASEMKIQLALLAAIAVIVIAALAYALTAAPT
ncbi:MAG TPA: hypothetical protein VN747_00080 [Burkholderiales bacterium]|jgi:hypothetical protein|nr:hypothetical protein [Burkholderiales bacterium]